MIYPEKNKLVYWLFTKYLFFIIKRNFQAINFQPIEFDDNKSLLVMANHFSWWDAFLMYYVFKKLTDKKMHVMVLEETLIEHRFFKYMGAFSVLKNSPESVKAINYSAHLLSDPQNIVLIFPQGKLYSNFVNDLKFEKGAIHIMNRAKGNFQLVYATTFTENFQHQRPTANVYLSKETNVEFEKVDGLTQAYQQHYDNARIAQTKIVV